jgi:putative inorganic carbon (hco3(-)) transporter
VTRQPACSIAAYLANPRHEWQVVAVAAPFLLFPKALPLVTAGVLLALLGVYGLQYISGTSVGLRSPLRVPLSFFAATVLIGVAVTPSWDVTLPKCCGVLLGLAAVRSIALSVRRVGDIQRAAIVYLTCGAAVLLLSLPGTAWGAKFGPLSAVTALIPGRYADLPGATAGINANALGGTTLLFLPLAISLSAVLVRPGVPGLAHAVWQRVAAFATAFVAVAVLLLTQSRTAWFAGVATIGVMLVVAVPRARWPTAAAMAVAVWFVHRLGMGSVGRIGTDASVSLTSRIEIWDRAILAIRDFPITGLGLNAFRTVAPTFYPLFLAPPSQDIAHAHNVFLQTALDIGIPGLVAYLAILVTATMISASILRRGDTLHGALALGLIGNIIGVHLFGLTDAIALGAKVGLFFWCSLGLLTGLHQVLHAHPAGRHD